MSKLSPEEEKLQLVIRYAYMIETYYKNNLIDIQNSMIKHCLADPEDVLKLYKAQIEYNAVKRLARDLEQIIHNYGSK